MNEKPFSGRADSIVAGQDFISSSAVESIIRDLGTSKIHKSPNFFIKKHLVL